MTLLTIYKREILIIYKPAARFSNDRKIYPILAYLTKILRHAKIRLVVRAAVFSKRILACLTIILRYDQLTTIAVV